MDRSLTNRTDAHNVRVDVFSAQMRALNKHERAAIAQAIDRQDVAELERSAIARRIKQARQEAGLSQPEMADALGVIARTYQNYESVSQPRVPWGSMNEIAAVTGKTTEWLIHGDRATPDLLGSVDNVDTHIDGVAVEFRRHVADLHAKLDTLIEQTAVLVDALAAANGGTVSADRRQATQDVIDRAEARILKDQAGDDEEHQQPEKRRATG